MNGRGRTGAAAGGVASEGVAVVGVVPVGNETRGRALGALNEAIGGLNHLVPLSHVRRALCTTIWKSESERGGEVRGVIEEESERE